MKSETSERGRVTVSVVMATYNQVAYIAKAIDSVLAQEANFNIEILVGDDCSTDGTTEVVREYYERFSDRIRFIARDKNIGTIRNGIDLLDTSRGKYIAFCDGDDYWTDPTKLQRQVDFLEVNPDYSLCCGAFVRADSVKNETVVVNKCSDLSGDTGFTFTLEEMKRDWLTQTLTSMIRREIAEEVLSKNYKYMRDIHIFYHAVKCSSGFYFNKVFGVYRFHGRGIHSGNDGVVNINTHYERSKEMYEKNGDAFTHRMYLRGTIRLFNFDLSNKYEENTFRRKLKLLAEALRVARNVTEYLWVIKGLVPQPVKTWLRQAKLWPQPQELSIK